jgi:cytochrome c oxidase assembly protein subunit 15
MTLHHASEALQHAPAETEPLQLRRIAIAFALLAALTYLLIVLGALVRAHGAGLACPDWPLCFGALVPVFDLKVAFEWSHRVLAGGVALGFAGLAALTLRRARSRTVTRLLAVGAALLTLQVILGALTVWHLLAAWTVTAHLVTGNAFAVCIAFTAAELAERAHPPARGARPGPGSVAVLASTGLLIAAQIVLGGLVSSTYAGLACSEWPACIGGAWFPSFAGAQGLHLLHRTNAYAVIAALGLSAWLLRRHPRIAGLALLAFAIGVAQTAVGVANVLLRIPVEMTGLHSALAAGLVLAIALTARETWLHR